MKSVFVFIILFSLFCASALAQEANQDGDTVCCISPRIVDEYGRLPSQDEKARLSNVASELNGSPNSAALFIIRVTQKESYSSIKNRVNKISKHLAEIERIPKERYKFVFSESDARLTTIYLLSSDTVNNFPDVIENLETLRPQRKPIIKKSKGN